MAISKEDVQINNFVKGIVTEANALSFPENASLEEVNFKLNRDGSRDRRLGIDFEDDFVLNSTGYTAEQLATSTRSFFRWPYASGSRTTDIGVIQIGGYLYFVNLLTAAPSANLLNNGNPINTGVENTATFEYALIGNNLIAVSSSLTQPYLATYNETTDLVTYVTAPIQVRDSVGVEDFLRVDERPIVLSNTHRYNLINQGWLTSGIESTCGAGVNPMDCTFETFQVYPSNSDQWSIGRIEDLTNADVKKYDPNLAKRNLLNNGEVPKGHFVIDAFDRGASRAFVAQLAGLPLDRELGRISTVATYAGRAWYAGVLSKVDGSDGRSPNFNGVIFYSQVMETPIDLIKCYQEADPTSPDISDPLATDGGVINIPECSRIVKLLAIKSSLFVFAENGIWEIRGGDGGFTHTSYQRNKISSMGVSSYKSIVEVNGQIFFWSYDGIYTLVPNDTGIYNTVSITLPTIQKLYNSLPDSARRTAKGYYDAANNKLRWLYYSEEAAYTGGTGTVIGGGDVAVPFDLQALLDAGVANILAGVGSDYRLNVDTANAFVAFQHKDAVYNGNAGAGGIRPAIGLSSAGIAMGYNDAGGTWHNAVAISATGDATFAGTVAANSILTNSITLQGSAYTIQDIIDLLGSAPATFDLQAALDAGVGFIKAGTGGNYEMIVDDVNHYVAFKHKDAVFEGVSTPGAGQTAVGISAGGIAMGFNDPSTGAWTNAIAITAAGDATFKGTIAANSIIVNSATIDGVTVGTIAGNASDAKAHSLLTGNVHNVSLTQVAGDLDDISDGASYFKTTSTEKTGAGRAATALDSSADYIRTIKSTKIVVSSSNPTTGWIADGSGIRLYQSGSLTVNLPVSGSPSFSGDITGGGDINITGYGWFKGAQTQSGFTAAIHANTSAGAANGIYCRDGSSAGAALVAHGITSGADGITAQAVGSGGRGIYSLGVSGANCIVAETASSGVAIVVNATGGALAIQTTGSIDVGGQVRCDNFRIDQSSFTGVRTATFTTTNKPGSTNTANQWIAIDCNGTTKYIPVWS